MRVLAKAYRDGPLERELVGQTLRVFYVANPSTVSSNVDCPSGRIRFPKARMLSSMPSSSIRSRTIGHRGTLRPTKPAPNSGDTRDTILNSPPRSASAHAFAGPSFDQALAPVAQSIPPPPAAARFEAVLRSFRPVLPHPGPRPPTRRRGAGALASCAPGVRAPPHRSARHRPRAARPGICNFCPRN